MTIDEIRTCLMCFTDTSRGAEPQCFNCSKRKFCDDITLVIMKHKPKEKEKTNEETQQDLLKPPSRYKAF